MVNLDYTTMWTSHNLLSVQFYGGFYEEGAAHPNSVIYTVNVDMKTGDLIKLPDLIDVKHDFIQLFMDKSQLVDGRGAGSDYESIKGDFFKAEDLTYSFDENAAFYFTSTGIVFTVGTIHAIGDYALFRLNFSDLSNYMKQTKQWGDIQSDFTSSEFQIIRDQSFKTTLPGFGSTWFISGFEQSSNDIINSLKFYLLDDNGHVKYTFPDYNSSSLGYYGIRAVSFNDVNHDGQKDVIIIAALHQNGQVEVDEAKVYLSDGDHFTMDNEFNSSLSKNLKATKTVSDVLGAAKSYYK